MRPVSCRLFFFIFFSLLREQNTTHHYHVPDLCVHSGILKWGQKIGCQSNLSSHYSFEGTPFLDWPTASRDVVNCLRQFRVSGGSHRRPLWGLFNLADVKCTFQRRDSKTASSTTTKTLHTDSPVHFWLLS